MEKVKEEIEKLEYKLFILQMKDRWDLSDYRYEEELNQKIKELKEKNGD